MPETDSDRCTLYLIYAILVLFIGFKEQATFINSKHTVVLALPKTCADPERGNHKNIVFLSNTDPDPLKEQASIQFWAIDFHWRNGDGPLFVVF